MDSLESLHDLFVAELKRLYGAEQQLTLSLPLLAKAANAPELKSLFEGHLEETQGHQRRLGELFERLDLKPGRETCAAMRALIEEAEDTIERDTDPVVGDAALVVAAQKIEHYEIAGYGSVRTFARILGYPDAAGALQSILDEEEAADARLSRSAEPFNAKAGAADTAEV